MLAACFVSCNKDTDEASNEEAKYNAAMALLEEGNVEGAYNALKELGDYAPAQKALERFRYVVTSASNEWEYEGETSANTRVVTYDENGLPIKSIERHIEGGKVDRESSYEYAYDNRGNLIQKIRITESYGKEISDYTYDSENNLIMVVYTNNDGSKSIHEYTYDEMGNKTKETYTSPIAGGWGYTYDYVYTYDAKGNVTTEVRTDSEGKKTTTNYTYDAKGKLIKEVSTYAGGNTETTYYTYDENGRLIKVFEKGSSGYQCTYEYAYDEKGNKTKDVYIFTGGDEVAYNTNYAYTYDVNGNPIKVVCTEEGYEDEDIYHYTYKLVYIPYDLSGEAHEVFNEVASYLGDLE